MAMANLVAAVGPLAGIAGVNSWRTILGQGKVCWVRWRIDVATGRGGVLRLCTTAPLPGRPITAPSASPSEISSTTATMAGPAPPRFSLLFAATIPCCCCYCCCLDSPFPLPFLRCRPPSLLPSSPPVTARLCDQCVRTYPLLLHFHLFPLHPTKGLQHYLLKVRSCQKITHQKYGLDKLVLSRKVMNKK